MTQKHEPRSPITILVPAAGFGRRVGSPTAKEMLPHPVTGRPLIDFVFDLATLIEVDLTAQNERDLENQWPVQIHLITRKEKSDLIEYASKKNADVQIISPSKEWPDTVLQSLPYWSDFNLLCLPDAEFAPVSAAAEMLRALQNSDLSVGAFMPSDIETYGAFRFTNGELWHAEKPKNELTEAKAWGLIAFRKNAGKELFTNMLESTFDHKWRKLPFTCRFFDLDRFVDLTRG